MSHWEKLQNIVRKVFDDENILIKRETTSQDVPGWDSLSHANLITAVESEFHVRFTPRELLSHQNIGDLFASIEEKLKESKA